MNKQQKQTAVLIALISLAALFALYQFVLAPFIDKGRQSSAELESLQNQLDEADRIVKGEAKLSGEYTNIVAELHVAEEQYIAPVENPLSWVNEKVYRTARSVGVEVESVAGITSQQVPWDKGGQKKDAKAGRVFKPYTVAIIAECGYADLLRLIDALEKSNPYLCISGFTISAQAKNVEKHQISLIVEWPTGSIKSAVRQGSVSTNAPAKT
jgi:hypothetical protein